jgi:hypothetical protein
MLPLHPLLSQFVQFVRGPVRGQCEYNGFESLGLADVTADDRRRHRPQERRPCASVQRRHVGCRGVDHDGTLKFVWVSGNPVEGDHATQRDAEHRPVVAFNIRTVTDVVGDLGDGARRGPRYLRTESRRINCLYLDAEFFGEYLREGSPVPGIPGEPADQ